MTIIREDLLLPFGDTYAAVSVALAQPEGPARGHIFCLHDYTGNARDFATLLPRLTRNGFGVILPDLVGRGESAHFAAANGYGPDADLQVLTEVRHRFGHAKMNCFLGTGYGAVTGLRLASVAQLPFQRLILLNLPDRWAPAEDGAVLEAQRSAGARFASADEAWANGVGRREFGEKCPPSLVAQRLRQEADGRFGLNLDPALLDPAVLAAQEAIPVRPLLKSSRGRVTLIGLPVDGDPKPDGRIEHVPLPRRAQLHERLETLVILGALLARR